MANIINGTDTGSGGLITTGDSSDELQLQTAETARVTLTNTAVVVNEDGNDVDFRVEGDTDANLLFVDAGNDRVGIGTSSPSAKLHIAGDNPFIRLDDTAGGSQQDYEIGTESAVFKIKNVGQATEPFTIDNSGNASIANGNLIFSTNGTGIDFSASAGGGATSSLLDDYEEGTWTPTLPFGGTISLASGTSAVYTKIGRQVTVSAFVVFSSIPNNSDRFEIGGLPYASSALTTYPYGSGSLSFTNFAVTDDLGGPLVAPNSSVLYFHFLSGSSSPVTNANVVTKGLSSLIFTFTYFVA